MEKDFNFKMTMSQIFWHWGYVPLVDVKLVRADASIERTDKEELTDVDVLGIKFLPEYRVLKIAADCTTRKRGAVMNRALILRGILDLVGADEGFVLVDPGKPLPQDHRAASRTLNIRLMDPGDAKFLLDRLNINSQDLNESNLFKEGAHVYLEKNLSNFLKGFSNAINYRKLRYWQDPTNEQLLNSIFHIKDISSKLKIPSQKFHFILAYEYFFFFAIATLNLAWHMASVSSPTNLESLDKQLRYYLYGGEKHYRLRLRMMEFLDEKLGTNSKNSSVMSRDVAPPEWRRFLDVYVRLALNPIEATYIPQILRLALFERVLYKNPDAYLSYFPQGATDISLKLIGDLARYFVAATGISSDFADLVERNITPNVETEPVEESTPDTEDNEKEKESIQPSGIQPSVGSVITDVPSIQHQESSDVVEEANDHKA